jgi:hypothetical protein
VSCLQIHCIQTPCPACRYTTHRHRVLPADTLHTDTMSCLQIHYIQTPCPACRYTTYRRRVLPADTLHIDTVFCLQINYRHRVLPADTLHIDTYDLQFKHAPDSPNKLLYALLGSIIQYSSAQDTFLLFNYAAIRKNTTPKHNESRLLLLSYYNTKRASFLYYPYVQTQCSRDLICSSICHK